ncbi:hypothetical protein EJ419_07250 [Alloscardovia theropitheci]|uniref:Uncharacterized protein n=1 Tax=Alloscardovia theropitheci TaxID=2496842 RepID=A0A4R0QRS3_9BIFI|nr:hypothetical protein [Alloscardovia theropitheci]TCD53755.1 hypothetical protein EJ419_07250 [Alloscardovia theropitheci]
MKNGKAYPTVNWQKAPAHELEHRRIIALMGNGTVIDSKTQALKHVNKIIDENQYVLHLDTRDPILDSFVLMFVNTRTGERRLNSSIRSLTVFDSPTVL